MSRSACSSDLRSDEQADGTVPYGAAHPHLVRCLRNMKIKNILLFISSVGFSLLIFEIGLRTFTVFPIHSPLANRVYDERLGYRLKPFSKEGDQNGFRNKKAIEKAEIVTLGDSHTFGYNVSIEESWPQQLSHMTNLSVYNLGMGGMCQAK